MKHGLKAKFSFGGHLYGCSNPRKTTRMRNCDTVHPGPHQHYWSAIHVVGITSTLVPPPTHKPLAANEKYQPPNDKLQYK